MSKLNQKEINESCLMNYEVKDGKCYSQECILCKNWKTRDAIKKYGCESFKFMIRKEKKTNA